MLGGHGGGLSERVRPWEGRVWFAAV
jgi:hypothetical protein